MQRERTLAATARGFCRERNCRGGYPRKLLNRRRNDRNTTAKERARAGATDFGNPRNSRLSLPPNPHPRAPPFPSPFRVSRDTPGGGVIFSAERIRKTRKSLERSEGGDKPQLPRVLLQLLVFFLSSGEKCNTVLTESPL